MADRFPLILNTSANQIQEIASGDQLDLSGNNVANAGIITATSFSGPVIAGAGVSNITAGIGTYTDLRVGGDTSFSEDLVVTGNARVTGILTVGTSSIILNDSANTIKVGTALTLGHTQGLQFHTQNLHSEGFEVNQVNASGIITATTFSGSGASLTNLPSAQLTGALPAISGASLTGITNANISNSAAIAGTKISPNFGSQNIVTTGTLTCGDITSSDGNGNLTLKDNNHTGSNCEHLINFTASDNTSLMNIGTPFGSNALFFKYGSTELVKIDSNAQVDFAGNVDCNAGLDVTGNVTATGDLTISSAAPKIFLTDTNNNDDFEIRNDDGTFTIRNSTDGNDMISVASNNTTTFNGNCDFMSGIDVSGNGTFTGNVSIGGTLTYEDVTNIDSVGIVTARDGVFLPDLKQLKIGNTAAAPDLYLWHNSSTGNSNISNKTGDLFIQGNNGSGTVVNQIVVKSNAAVELNYQGTKKFETKSTGIELHNGGLDLNRSSVLHSGAIYFDSPTDTNHVLWNDYFGNPNASRTTTGNFDGMKWNCYGGLQLFRGNEAEDIAKFLGQGACELYHANQKKFETVSGGAKITGTATATGSLIVGSGNEFQVTRSSGNTEIQNYSGTLLFSNASSNLNNVLIRARADENSIMCIPDGAVDLYWNNNIRIKTHEHGTVVKGGANNVHVYLQTNDGTQRGEVYANNSNQVGFLDETGNWAVNFDRNGSSYCFSHFLPGTDDTYDLGATAVRWRNLYVNDLQLSNEAKKDGGGNDVDGTWGDYTIQEGESDLFLINNRSGKKYKFNLTEVS